LVTAGKVAYLAAIDPASGQLLQKVAFAPEQVPATPDPTTKPGTEPGSQLSFTGLAFSPNGERIYLSNVAGNVKVFAVSKNHQVSALTTLAVPEARTSKRKMEIPAGLAVSADGKRL
jgi:hypothetical protein